MILSANEWGPLKRIIVGTTTNAHWPVNCKTFRNLEKTTGWKHTPVPKGPVSDTIIKESNDDLENLVLELTKLNITVERPKDLNFEDFDGMYNYCPRDRLLIIGDKVIDAPMMYPTRKKEIEALSYLIDADIITCQDEDVIFDAANICRLGNDLLYLVSDSGNIAGAKWLQRILGSTHKVHILNNIYSGVHIDSTIGPVNEGLVVLNGDRINKNNLPDVFKTWDKIYITGDNIIEQQFVKYPYASKYIALNFLTVSPTTVICDPNQTYLQNKLNEKNVDTIGVKLRHSRTLGGGHHCVTLDLERD
jgi:N-dimethylarginine dimethylaminohydrolase